jgi:hypothetical protein
VSSATTQGFFLALSAMGVLAGSARAQILLAGRVLDENNAAVSGARVVLRPVAAGLSAPDAVATGPAGRFTLRLPAKGPYKVNVTHDGFFALENQTVDIEDPTQSLQLVLNHAHEVFERIEVRADSNAIDVDQTASEKTLTNMQILNVPYVGRDLGSALKLLPGVVQDALGDFHLSGSSVNQVMYTLDGFNIGDPVSGRLNTRLNIDSVRSVQYSTGRYSPEYGKGSAGVVAFDTQMGTDRFRYSATNFVPGIDTATGPHIGTWSPRFGISGPIRKGRAWYSESIDGEYTQTVVEDVKDHNRTPASRVDNLLRTQVNLTPGTLLYFSFLVNGTSAPGAGLSALDPYSTTINRRTRTWFASVKAEKYLARGARIEWGYAEDRTFSRTIPQGSDFYRITPYGRDGNFYVDSRDEARRGQLLVNYSAAPMRLAGTHQIRMGADLDRLDYQRDVRRTGYEQYGIDGRIINRVTFGGSGVYSLPSAEAAWYVVDSWKPRPNLVIEPGLRQDWDELVRRAALSPRISVSYAPFRWKNTKITGGYAITRDAVTLEEFSRPRDQYSLSTSFHSDGSIAFTGQKTLFSIGPRPFEAPKFTNWTAGLEQKLPRNLLLAGSYQRKRGENGLTYVYSPPPYPADVMAAFELKNFRRDTFDSAEVTLRQTFGRQFGWMASYTRSRALSNAVISLVVDQPIWVTDNFGRMPWDSPNRFLGWGYFPTPWPNWAISCALDARDGYPFTVQTDHGVTVGEVNSHRLPFYFDLDLHLERRFRLGKHRVALRGGFNNITGHQNPNVVNNVIGASNYLSYYGSQGRHVVFRLRWLGAVEP